MTGHVDVDQLSGGSGRGDIVCSAKTFGGRKYVKTSDLESAIVETEKKAARN